LDGTELPADDRHVVRDADDDPQQTDDFFKKEKIILRFFHG
jgi:hypothetical protein